MTFIYVLDLYLVKVCLQTRSELSVTRFLEIIILLAYVRADLNETITTAVFAGGDNDNSKAV